MRLIAAAAFFLALAACSPPSETGSAESANQGALAIESPWAAPTPGGVDVSAGYLTIANGTAEADALVSASSPRAASVELHEMTMDGGVMQMRAVTRLEIGAGQSVSLAPGGRHLMFMGVTQPFAVGETIAVRLHFEHAGEVDVSLPVQSAAGSHNGH
jgi:periplasmic copper chaperone A